METRGFSLLCGILVISTCIDAYPLQDVHDIHIKHAGGLSKEAVHKGVLLVREILGSLVKDYVNGRVRSAGANEYVDQVLARLRKYFSENMDPLDMGEYGDIKWIHLEGLSTIFRSGEADIQQVGDNIVLKINLGFANLRGEAYFEKNLWWQIWVTGTGKAQVRNLNIYTELQASMEDNVKPKLLELTVTDWGDLTVTFEGGNWLGKIIEAFSDTFPQYVTDFLKKNLPDMIKNGISKVLEDFDLNFGY